MFTITITTKDNIHVLKECNSYYYDKDSDTLRIVMKHGKQIFCIPYREVLEYFIEGY